jgi:hypothetical protein
VYGIMDVENSFLGIKLWAVKEETKVLKLPKWKKVR